MHDCYTDADPDRPDAICDGNGSVTLSLCKRCGKAEAELDAPCLVPPCECGVRGAKDCPGAWEKGCDLGANEATTEQALPGWLYGAKQVRDAASELIRAAAERGLVLTIEQEPLQPFAMGHYAHKVTERKARNY